MERSHRLLLVAGLLVVLLPTAAATFGPQPGAPCEPTLLATQVALFCAPDMPTALCCEPVVTAVDLGGGVPCLCRVAAEPQLVMAGLNATRLLTLYSSCGGLRPGGAHLAAACEGPLLTAAVVSSQPPPPPSPAPRRKQPAHDAPPPPPPSSEKPSSPPPQEHDGAAHAMAVPTQAATSPPAAPENAPAPSPLPHQHGGAAVTVSRALGYIFTCALYLSPITIIVGICRTGHLGQHKVDVFIITFTSCVIWVLYGVSRPFNRTIVIINAVGVVIEAIYIGIFVWYSSAVGRMWTGITLVSIGGILGFTAAGVFFSSGSPHRYLGILADASSIAMYFGPVRQMIAVWNAKIVQNSSLPVAAASVMNGVSWTLYAAFTHNIFLLIPNVVGIVSGIGQLGLFLIVKYKYQQQ